LNNMKTNTFGRIFLMLSIPLVLLTCNTFAEDIIDELHKESALLVSQERYDEALEVFDQILEIDSDNVKAMVNRSAVLVIIGENEKAISVADKILTIQPNNVKALSNKATALANIGYTYDAISIFERGLETDPDNQKLIDGRNFLFGLIDLLPLSPNEQKYDVHLHVQVRTDNDQLISVTEGIQSEYLPFHITDEFLNDYPIIQIVEKNGKDYEMRQIKHRTDVTDEKAYGHINLNILCKTVYGCVHIFAEKTPSILVHNGDYMLTQWTIYRLVE